MGQHLLKLRRRNLQLQLDFLGRAGLGWHGSSQISYWSSEREAIIAVP